MVDLIGVETRVMLLAAGLVFVWALLLGVQKYAQILASPNACAHPYTDIAHRAALMYSFALLLIAAFAELSTWDWRIDLAAGLALTTFFVAAIGSYQFQGLRQQTDNHGRVDRRRDRWVRGTPGRFRQSLDGLTDLSQQPSLASCVLPQFNSKCDWETSRRI